ncbi:hypothetical protein CK203_100505 [Vitis vinifera]|uniref:Uncharacterized protein n=1 Tax=Vitis vinifera TaxID=29760 RepID=A0A438EZV4_VITVI|nr:hypothetical protein CK203_100505 [Vitis vinifera]
MFSSILSSSRPVSSLACVTHLRLEFPPVRTGLPATRDNPEEHCCRGQWLPVAASSFHPRAGEAAREGARDDPHPAVYKPRLQACPQAPRQGSAGDRWRLWHRRAVCYLYALEGPP